MCLCGSTAGLSMYTMQAVEVATSLLFLLWRGPWSCLQMRQEQAAVQAQHGNQLTPAAVAAMPYTTAVVKETLRTAQVIGYVPRVATQALKVPGGGPELQSGCPFIVALGAMAASDPAAAAAAVSAAGQGSPDSQAGTVQDFRPERWLQPELAKSLALHQAPFGMGAHYCLGSQLAMAELTAVLAELARSYSLTADTDTDWPGEPLQHALAGRRAADGWDCRRAGDLQKESCDMHMRGLLCPVFLLLLQPGPHHVRPSSQ